MGAAAALQWHEEQSTTHNADYGCDMLQVASELLTRCRHSVDAIQRLPKGHAQLEHDEDVIKLPAMVDAQLHS